MTFPTNLRTLLAAASVGEIARRDHPLLDESQSIQEAVQAMRINGRGSALICRQRMLCGIFTERDYLRLVHQGGDLQQPVRAVMTPDPSAIGIRESLLDALIKMQKGGYRRLPALDAERNPVGIVDVKSIVEFLVEHFPHAIYNQAAHRQLLARRPEGA